MHNPRMSKIAAAALLVAGTVAIAAPTYAAKHSYKDDVVVSKDVVATSVVQRQALKDGPYVGVGVGYDSYRIRQNSSISDDDGDVFSANPPLSGRSFVGSIFAGYGQYFNNMFYLAGELNYNFSDAEAKYSVGNALSAYNASISGRNSFGVSLIPGVKVTDASLLYAKIGYVRTNFKATESQTGALTGNYNTSVSKNVSGTDYGVGMETLVSDKLSVRAEYNYINYNSFTNATSGSKFSPKDNQFMVGLVYHVL